MDFRGEERREDLHVSRGPREEVQMQGTAEASFKKGHTSF